MDVRTYVTCSGNKIHCNIITSFVLTGKFREICARLCSSKQSAIVLRPMWNPIQVISLSKKRSIRHVYILFLKKVNHTKRSRVWAHAVCFHRLHDVTSTVPSAISDCCTSQKGGAQPGSHWHLFSWLQTCHRSQSVMLSPLHTALKCVILHEVLTPRLLHLAEQPLVPYAFMVFTSWQRWLKHTWKRRRCCKNTDLQFCSRPLQLSYHVVATLCTSRYHAQICRVVIFWVHSCFIAYFSISYFVKGFPGCHWELPSSRAEKCPAGLISVTKNHTQWFQNPAVPLFKSSFHYIPAGTSLAEQRLSAVPM